MPRVIIAGAISVHHILPYIFMAFVVTTVPYWGPSRNLDTHSINDSPLVRRCVTYTHTSKASLTKKTKSRLPLTLLLVRALILRQKPPDLSLLVRYNGRGFLPNCPCTFVTWCPNVFGCVFNTASCIRVDPAHTYIRTLLGRFFCPVFSASLSAVAAARGGGAVSMYCYFHSAGIYQILRKGYGLESYNLIIRNINVHLFL